MDKGTLAQIGGALREGHRIRVSHGCGSGKTMLVSREGSRVSAHCFRCNKPEPGEDWHADLRLSIHDNLFRVRESLKVAADAEYAGSTECPGPLLPFSEWPPVARLWLLRVGMADKDAARIGAGWHEDMQRVVLPLRDRFGADVSWTARAVDGRLPKYLTGALPDGFVAELGPLDQPPTAVEDWLSANKLAMAGVHVVCMLGTYPKPATLLRLMDYKECFVWLDNDLPPAYPKNWGQIMAARVCKTLRAYGIAPTNIASAVDPKLMDRISIRRELARSVARPTTSVSAPDGEKTDG